MQTEHINPLLDRVLEGIDQDFQKQAQEWPLVKRNRAITARNRNWKAICEMLDMSFEEMPLEQPERTI